MDEHLSYDFPSDPSLGQIHSSYGKTWKWTGVNWALLSPAPAGAQNSLAYVYFSASPPANPANGLLWYDTVLEKLKLRTSEGWVDITSSVPTPEPPVLVSATAPPNAQPGFLWYDTINDVLKVRVAAPGGNIWQLASSSSPNECPAVTVSASPPSDPSEGALWYDTLNNEFKVWHVGSSTSQWILISQSCDEDPTPVLVSASPPVNPLEGYFWYDTVNHLLNIWTLGPQGGVWLSTTPEPGRAPPPVILSSSEPPDPTNGSLWYDTIHNVLNLRDNSQSPGEWVQITEAIEEPENCTKTTISSSPPPNPSPGDFWYDAENSNLNMWYVDLDGGQWISVVPYPQERVTTQGGTFEGPILAGYTIPNDPLAFVTVKWIQDYIAEHGTAVPITSLPDVDPTGLTNKSTLVYDSATTMWKTDITLPDITNGGTY